MQRTIQPELLDTLPPEHPDALHNRRDLRWVNGIMGNHAWISRTLRRHRRPAEPALEIGAGLGELARRLAKQGLPVDALDRWPRPVDWPADRAWHQADLRAFADYGRYAVVIANLILHQLHAPELAALGTELRRHSRLIIACEPARSRRARAGFWLMARACRFNHVSRHDGDVSIIAGFREHELPRALGFPAPGWQVRCRTTWRGACRLLAVRQP